MILRYSPCAAAFLFCSVASAQWMPIDSPVTQPWRAEHACAWDPVNDMIYMYGGSRTRGNSPFDLCQRYDPARDTWFDMAPMSSSRHYIKGLYCRGKLYALGGGGDSTFTSCEAYDIAADSWSPIARLPFSLWSYQAVVWRDSLIYVMGGNINDTIFSDSVLIYSPFTNAWTRATSMPAPLAAGDACIIGDTIYFAGGLHRSYYLDCDTTLRIGVIDPAAAERIEWSWGPSIVGPRCNGPTIAARGRVYWFGGLYGGNVSHLSFCYDPATGRVIGMPDYAGWAAFCCFGVADEKRGVLYGLAGDYSPRWVPEYNQFVLPGFYDVGVTRIIVPTADVDSGDTFAPVAEIGNFGRYPESFRAMFRIGSQYSDVESTYVLPGETARVSFAPWIANCRGVQVVKCSTMMADDNQHGNDVSLDTLMVHFFDPGVNGLNLPDTVPEGNFTPIATVQNYDRIPGALWVEWRVLRDDTLLVYAHRESTSLAGHGTQWVTFPMWNAKRGSYLMKVFATCHGVVMRDTVQKHFRVGPTGIQESNEPPLPRDFALDVTSPNPSRDAITIRYALPQAADISLKLYDATGKLRAILDQGRKAAGRYSVTFVPRPSSFVVSSGVYLIRLNSPSFVRTRKVVITQ